jgi:hypothetical protein
MKISVFWDVMQCCLIVTSFSEEHALCVLYPEDRGTRFLQNIVNDLADYMVSIPEDTNLRIKVRVVPVI